MFFEHDYSYEKAAIIIHKYVMMIHRCLFFFVIISIILLYSIYNNMRRTAIILYSMELIVSLKKNTYFTINYLCILVRRHVVKCHLKICKIGIYFIFY